MDGAVVVKSIPYLPANIGRTTSSSFDVGDARRLTSQHFPVMCEQLCAAQLPLLAEGVLDAFAERSSDTIVDFYNPNLALRHS